MQRRLSGTEPASQNGRTIFTPISVSYTHLDVYKRQLIGGLSLGGQILLEILSKNPNICECAIIESAFVMPMDLSLIHI